MWGVGDEGRYGLQYGSDGTGVCARGFGLEFRKQLRCDYGVVQAGSGSELRLGLYLWVIVRVAPGRRSAVGSRSWSEFEFGLGLWYGAGLGLGVRGIGSTEEGMHQEVEGWGQRDRSLVTEPRFGCRL